MQSAGEALPITENARSGVVTQQALLTLSQVPTIVNVAVEAAELLSSKDKAVGIRQCSALGSAMSGVFISYRRDDSSGYAGRLFDILSVHLGRENTYMDLDTIRGGDNFATVIEEKISQCDVLLAVIGERWLTSTGENGRRRLDMANDFVRLEIAKALERGVRVIPVLVGGATMPHQDDLPDDLRPLSVHQAMDLRDAHFHADVDQLVDLLDKIVPSIASRQRKVKSKRLALAVSSVLAVVVILGGILVVWQVKPAAHPNPDSAAQKRTAPANAPVPSAQPVNPIEADKSRSLNTGSADVSGKWKATVKYDWPGAIYEETFSFEVVGTELSGTASLLQVDHGIFDGKIEGDQVRFTTKSLTALDDKTYQDVHYYKGTIEGDTIRFSMLTDSSADSHVPVHFTAKR